MATKKRKSEIEDLRDETLTEILVRLPVKSGHQCKLVSKRWLGLTSSKSFALCHRKRHVNHTIDDEYNHILLANYMINAPSNPCPLVREVHALPKNQNQPLVSLDFLNQQWPMNLVLLVSNDLLLTVSLPSNLGVGGGPSLHLHVSNPLTKQSYRLPQPPPCFFDDNQRNPLIDFTGIICSVDDPTQYKVVLVKNSPRLIRRGCNIVRSSEILDIYVFSSDTGGWCNFVVPSPPNFLAVSKADEADGQYATTLDGALYWCTNMIMVYNPFDRDNPDFIDLPQEAKIDEMYVEQRSLCIENVEQHLRLYHWHDITASTQTVTVWDLKDYSNGHATWNIKHFVDLTSINWQSADVRMSIKGFDPFNGDVLYVYSEDHCLMAVNLRSKTVQLVSDFNSSVFSPIPSFRLFPYRPPLWPTPITNTAVAKDDHQDT
ncbi:uncharacterized protein LOC110738565 [Chenopodium quinoa]|uniref:F-box protein At3g26010-like beta-propeller domain-containing protein n=1 Tax=Chenopodium quinoa TaxID=63459 RepID=A0A803M5J1_CHEQI|nr:uncharacterized protein LOC110738565 [Chenopodium quinoa]